MKDTKILLLKFFTVIVTAVLFYFTGRIANRLCSYTLSMTLYWVILSMQIPLLMGRGFSLRQNLLSMTANRGGRLLTVAAFSPALPVFIAAFLPLIGGFNLPMFALALAIAFFNGIIEEIYWRGTAYRFSTLAPVIAGTMLFSLNHGAFLFLDFKYQGGALSLVGGPLIMGTIWAAVARRAGTIRYCIFAHQLVNLFAFYSLFVSNTG